MRMVYGRVVQQGYATLWVEVEKRRTAYESPGQMLGYVTLWVEVGKIKMAYVSLG